MSRPDAVVEELWYGRGPAQRLLRGALAPASLLFAAAASLRGALYDRGVFATGRAPAPVVSVGSLRVGGAGKTPFVLWLAARLKERGLRPCLVTSGYGGSLEGRRSEVLLPGQDWKRFAGEAGDEAALLAVRSGCPVAAGRDRLEACRRAAAAMPPDLFLLDDGFQHRALERDLDVVLLAGSEAGERLLPAGPLREPLPALARAGAVVTVESEGTATPTGAVPSAAGAALQLRARMRATQLVAKLEDCAGEALDTLAGRRVLAVAGIARPQRFLAGLERAGAVVMGSVLRRDHHRYDDADRREIDARAAAADLVVTTEKDLVKLASLGLAAPLRALRIDVGMQGADALIARIENLVRASRAV